MQSVGHETYSCRFSRQKKQNLRYLRNLRAKIISHADLADFADKSKNQCLSVQSVGQETFFLQVQELYGEI